MRKHRVHGDLLRGRVRLPLALLHPYGVLVDRLDERGDLILLPCYVPPVTVIPAAAPAAPTAVVSSASAVPKEMEVAMVESPLAPFDLQLPTRGKEARPLSSGSLADRSDCRHSRTISDFHVLTRSGVHCGGGGNLH